MFVFELMNLFCERFWSIIFFNLANALENHRSMIVFFVNQMYCYSAVLHSCFYMDSIGSIASLGNRLFLKASQPALAQVLFWDRWLVKCSKLIDPLIQHSFGKSIVALFNKM